MFKYSPINSYSLQNLQRSQIYFNNPLDFNDPFDTFHPATVGGLSNKVFATLFCKLFKKRKFDKKTILKILDGNISKKEFLAFCQDHIDYFFEFNEANENFAYKSKENYLSTIEKNQKKLLPEDIGELLTTIKHNIENTIIKSLREARKNQFSKVGVTCFSRNNSNLLMWSHYADSHKGICLEFDSTLEPFSKSFEVMYDSNIPIIESDLLFEEEHSFESLRKLLSFKSKDWEHEEELRLLHQEKNKEFGYPRYALKAIYFGLKTNQTDLEIICSLVKSHNPKIRFFKMKRLETKFGLEPEEFFYSTPIEVQSKLIMEISNTFKNEAFKLDELHEIVKIHIQKQNLESHLEELIRLGVLEKEDDKYKLKI